jgi:hypothetical protein
MAAIALGKITLIDKWPGAVNPNLGIPKDGWSAHADDTDPRYPIGTKIMAYSDATVNPGYYTMAYAEVASVCDGGVTGNGGPEGDVSAGGLFVGHADMTQPASDLTYNITTHDGSAPPPVFVVHSCYSSMTDLSKGTGRVGLSCSTASGYGHVWMWIGGVCPVEDVTKFQGAASSLNGGCITVTTNISSRALYVVDTTALGLVFNTCPTAATQTVDGTANFNCMIGFCDIS